MKFLILGEMNEFEAGIAIIVMLLKSDSVDEIDEQRFLEGKLLDFQQNLLESQQKSE
jgi:hypothetical protein